MKSKKISIPLLTILIILISQNVYASSVFQWGLVELPYIEFLQGEGPFVSAFNFCFTLVSFCGLIAVIIKAVLKVITRS